MAQTGAVLISLAMIKSAVFTRFTGWLGLIMHGIDLLHIAAGPFSPTVGAVLMMIAGPMYPIWFLLVGQRLWTLSKQAREHGI